MAHTLTNSLVLGGVAMVAATLLGTAHVMTEEEIRLRAADDLRTSLRQVLPAHLYDNDPLADARLLTGPDGSPLRVYRALQHGQVTAVAFESHGKGYAGDIRLMLGLDTEGRLLGVRVTEHHETPGLGDRIEAAKSDWITRFTCHSLGDPPEERWRVKKDGGDFDQFSGATITPRAVLEGIRHALLLFAARRPELLAPEAIKTSAPSKGS
jgi:electron transport complex protein RnfG